MPLRAHAQSQCPLEVIGATASVRPSTQPGIAGNEAHVEVDVRSTATVALDSIQLAIFLGVDLKAQREARWSALPTLKPIQLGGGLAVRYLVSGVVRPGTRAVLAAPLTGLSGVDASTVNARVISCGVASRPLAVPPQPGTRSSRTPIIVVAAVVSALAGALIWGFRRGC